MTEKKEKKIRPLDEHKEYLAQKFGTLIESFGEGYGKPLQDELMKRLEGTISEFHTEVSELVEQLKEKSRVRYDRLQSMLEDESNTDNNSDEKPDEVTEWEKRLAENESVSNSEGEKQSDNKKKGFFKRK